MIAGDLNIVDVQLVVQYRIRDLTAFLFNVADPGEGQRLTGSRTSRRAAPRDAPSRTPRKPLCVSS